MKRILLATFVFSAWAFIIILMILVSNAYGPSGGLVQYYRDMSKMTWQSHFNIDLWVHTVLFACWIYYRHTSKVVGVLLGVFAVYLGGNFTFLYTFIALVRSKGDPDVFFKGSRDL